MYDFVRGRVWVIYNDNNNTLSTHRTSRSDKNSFQHVRETKNVKKKRNNLKLPLITAPD